MRKRVTTLVGVAMAAVLVPLASPTGVFAGTLDQSQTIVGANSDDSRPVGYVGQTFTAGLSGELDQVDVYVRRNPACTGVSALAVDMYPRTGSPFPQGFFARAVVPADRVPTSFGWVSFVFPNPAIVTAGGENTFLLRPLDAAVCDPGQSAFHWALAPRMENPYPGGDGFTCRSLACDFVGDYAFKTYVATPPPPPPEFTRELTLKYSQKKESFTGEVASRIADCVSAQWVTVFKMEKGPDPSLASDRTGKRGKYSLKARHADGKFYARAHPTTLADGICLTAKSEAIKVG